MIFIAGAVAFHPARTGRAQRKRAKLAAAEEAAARAAAARLEAGMPTATKTFSPGVTWLQFPQARIEVVGVLKSIPFLVMVAFGMTNAVGS